MGKINLGKVIAGGLVAGLVLNVFDFVLHGVILAADWNAALAALNKPAMGGNTIGMYVGFDFLTGIGLVWLYAAIRPRFGPGVQTAVIAGIAGWFFCGLIATLYQMPNGIFPMKLMVMPLVASLVFAPVATVAGASIYKE